jgi:nucleoside-diphosphate-sugar epimerase
MDVAVAGGHGKVALRLLRLLAQRGDRARGLIRNADHADDLRAIGAEPVLCDLEGDDVDVESAIDGADAVVFAAGAGAGSGAERKRTMDLGGALRLIEACRATGVDRYVMISSMGADQPERAEDPVFRAYLEAKGAADAALRDSGLRWTIVRPGGLTDAPGTGRVDAAPDLGRRGEIPRDDVAATLVAVLDEPRTAGVQFEVLSGDTPIAEAIAALAR